MQSFIEVYDHVLTPEECQECISLFESLPKRSGGISSTDGTIKHDSTVKKTIELKSSKFTDNSRISHLILKGLVPSISQYYQTHYQSLHSLSSWRLDDGYNVQKYVDETDGFKVWHCESGRLSNAHRILVWMIYLNTCQSGTDFYYYPSINAEQGRCVIWPSAWTHTHRSTPNKDLKYLATGWISFV